MRKAFTLIELLVVIAIIAILAAILFPVFAQAKEAAKKTQCLSNAKGLATAVQIYAADYDDTVLPWLTCSNASTYCPGGPTASDSRIWTNHIQPYVKNGGGHPKAGIFVDPSFTYSTLFKGADQADCDGNGSVNSANLTVPAVDANGKERSYADYGIAFAMCAPSEVSASFPCTTYTAYGRTGLTAASAAFLYPGSMNYPKSVGGLTRNLTEIVRPAETVILGDGATFIGPTFTGTPAGNFFRVMLGCESTFMHSLGGNYAFLDSHAKFLKGNPEKYRKQTDTGLWIETYFYWAG